MSAHQARATALACLVLSMQLQAQELPPAANQTVDRESRDLLKKRLLERRLESIQSMPLSTSTKEKLLRSDNFNIVQRALSDQSLKSPAEVEDAVKSRLLLQDVGEAAKEQEIARFLESRGIDAEQLTVAAEFGAKPDAAVKDLRKKLGTGASGRILLLQQQMMVNPEPTFKDSLAPGKLPASGQTPDGTVWRSGLMYAGVLTVAGTGAAQAVCSGTMLADGWFLTAAHCLLNEAEGRMYAVTELFIYLPFQDGTETIRGVSGSKNVGMRRLKVNLASWVGESVGRAFPTRREDFSSILDDGQDIAMLQVDANDFKGLPRQITPVRRYRDAPKLPPLSSLGYGWSNAKQNQGLDLGVGVKDSTPAGLDAHDVVLRYGAPINVKAKFPEAAICGGDSGGGLFAGRLDGVAEPRLIGINSGLKGNVSTSDAQVCVATGQLHTSVMVGPGAKFLCDRSAATCQ